MTLNELGIKYHTDKSTLLHDYLNQYEKLFTNPNDVLNVCEIGLQRGGRWRIEGKELPSVKMWLEFFPNANFYGFDLKHLQSDNERVKILQGDQGNKKDLTKLYNAIPKDIDFIIDDGSHIAEHQLNTFKRLFPKVKEGGIYIIEDCKPSVQKDLSESEKIHALIEPYLQQYKHVWMYSNASGDKSSLAIFK